MLINFLELKLEFKMDVVHNSKFSKKKSDFDLFASELIQCPTQRHYELGTDSLRPTVRNTSVSIRKRRVFICHNNFRRTVFFTFGTICISICTNKHLMNNGLINAQWLF